MKPDKGRCETCPKKGTLDCGNRLKFRQTVWAFFNDHLQGLIPLSRLDAMAMKVFDDGFYPEWIKKIDLAPVRENG